MEICLRDPEQRHGAETEREQRLRAVQRRAGEHRHRQKKIERTAREDRRRETQRGGGLHARAAAQLRGEPQIDATEQRPARQTLVEVQRHGREKKHEQPRQVAQRAFAKERQRPAPHSAGERAECGVAGEPREMIDGADNLRIGIVFRAGHQRARERAAHAGAVETRDESREKGRTRAVDAGEFRHGRTPVFATVGTS